MYTESYKNFRYNSLGFSRSHFPLYPPGFSVNIKRLPIKEAVMISVSKYPHFVQPLYLVAMYIPSLW